MQPASFDESLMTEWSLWVLDRGLPELPGRVEVGQSVPVARWVGSRFAAVLQVQWVSIEGIAGVEATHIEVMDRDGTMRRPIESPFGAFIACTDGDHEATLRVLDRDGDALLTTRFSSQEFRYEGGRQS